MLIVSLGDHLHEMSYPILGENKKNLFILLSAESVQSVVSDTFQMSVRKKSATKLCFS